MTKKKRRMDSSVEAVEQRQQALSRQPLSLEQPLSHDGDGKLEDVFFFSSRRRHKRFSRDWSSDVCSSDLASTAASRSLVVVLPVDPVTPTTCARERARTAAPRAPRAASGSSTSMRGPAA